MGLDAVLPMGAFPMCAPPEPPSDWSDDGRAALWHPCRVFFAFLSPLSSLHSLSFHAFLHPSFRLSAHSRSPPRIFSWSLSSSSTLSQRLWGRTGGRVAIFIGWRYLFLFSFQLGGAFFSFSRGRGPFPPTSFPLIR
eukprot:RCo033381